MTRYSYDPFDFLPQAEVDFKANRIPSAFTGVDSAYDLAHGYAKDARDEHYRRARQQGCTAKRSVLKGQLEKYQSWGVPGRGFRDVYCLVITHEEC